MAELSPNNAAEIAKTLAQLLDAQGQEYAIGGALALGYWSVPRGTVDVDITVFLPHDKPSECVWLLQEIKCDFVVSKAVESLREHGYCQVLFTGTRVDIFVPTISFYTIARERRKSVDLNGYRVFIWDAESLLIFKMMFFRRKDLADAEQILRTQGPVLDRAWVRTQLVEIYGNRDPRIAAWDELDRDVPL